MSAERGFAWCLFALWSAWLFALQGYLAARSGPSFWVPDMGVVLLLMLDRKNGASSMLLALLIVTSARLAFSADPPLAILFGYGALIGCMRVLRRVLEVDQVLIRALLAGLGFLSINKYWELTRGIALRSQGQLSISAGSWSNELSSAGWSMALATGLGMLVLGPLLVRLPGLSPLQKGDR